MPYPVASVRGRNFGNAPVIPWYLSGGIAAANCIAAYAPKGAADLAASYVNLANPGTYNVTANTAPDWDATNGWKFNGTSHSLNSNVVPNKIHSVIMKFTNGGTTNSRAICGTNTDTTNYPRYMITPKNAVGTGATMDYGNSSVAIAGVATEGVLALTPAYPYKDGVAGSAFAAWGALANQTGHLYIGSDNYPSGTPRLWYACYMQAFAIYDITLSGAQVTALTTAMAAM